MEENKSVKFLNTIYKISEMGVVGINDVYDKIKKSDFREFLESQKREYNEVMKEAEKIFTSYGKEEKNLSKMTKMSSKMTAEAELMNNCCDEKIASMMVKGTEKGITKLNHAFNEYNLEDEQIEALSKKLMRILKNNLERLKIYL